MPTPAKGPATLAGIVSQINKEHGVGTLVRGSELANQTVQRITSGSLALDVILGGGWPVNQTHEIIGEASHGKGLPLGTPIPTPDGWRLMGDLAVGDLVFGSDGEATRVTAVSEIHHRPCFKVVFSDGTTQVTDDQHRWLVSEMLPGGRRRNRVVTTAAMSVGAIKHHGGWRWCVPLSEAVRYPAQDLLIEPYTMGAWLADGDSASASITKDDPHVRLRVSQHYLTKELSTPDRCARFSIWLPDGSRKLTAELKRLDVLRNKHIPPEYLLASVAQRRALLTGLMDGDGHCSNGQNEYSTTRFDLAVGVAELVRSLGCKASISEGRATLEGKDCGPKYRVLFYGHFNPFDMPRKAATWRGPKRPQRLAITAVEPVLSVPTRCIAVDAEDELYLCGREYRVTHNTAVVLQTVAANQRIDPDWRVWWLAAEHFDPGYAELCGVDLDRIFIHDTNVTQEGLQKVLQVAGTREVDAIVIDSLPALVPNEEEERESGEWSVGLGARLNNQYFRKSGTAAKRNLITVDRPLTTFIINQYREKIGVMHGDPRVAPGGRQKDYAYYTRVEVRRDDWIKVDDEPIGQVIKVKTTKNKSHRPYRTAVFDFYFAAGGPVEAGRIDSLKEIVDIGIAYDVIRQGGGGMFYMGDRSFKGRAAVADYVRSDDAARSQLVDMVIAVTTHGTPPAEVPAPPAVPAPKPRTKKATA